jgi:Flp pilus assembly CpaF family ATPase/intein/homing endonuclease
MGYLDDLIAKAKKPEEKPAEAKPGAPAAAPAPTARPAAAQPAPTGQAAAELLGEVEAELPAGKELVASYGYVKIFKLPTGDKMYTIPVPRPFGPERRILDTVREAATRLITVPPEEIKEVKERREFYKRRILEIIEASPELGIPPAKIDFYAETVMRDMIGYGPLDLLLADDQLEEVMVIGVNKPVYVFHRKHEMMKTNVLFGRDEDIMAIIDRIARDVGRRIDVKDPLLDARLPDGSRVNATIPPISLEGSTITIRKFREDPLTVVDLVRYKTMSADLAAFLWLAVEGMKAKPANVLVSGGTGSGKTSTLNVLANFIPRTERIITMEDSVAGDEEVWVLREGKAKKTRIAELVDDCVGQGCEIRSSGHEVSNMPGYYTLAFDKNGKVTIAPIRSFIRHKTAKQLYEVRMISGRKIKVTADHSLFTLGPDGKPRQAKPAELAGGSTLIVAPEIQFDKLVTDTGSQVQATVGQMVSLDEVLDVAPLPKSEQFVYDLSVPELENFWCSDFFVHNTAEIKLPVEHWIRLETRPPGIEGTGEVTMDTLVKNSLRMRPDRIIVGEIRGAEGFTLFTAINTGHDGCETFSQKVPLTSGLTAIGEFVNPIIEQRGRVEGEFEVADTAGHFVTSLDASGKAVKSEIVKVMRRRYAGEVLKLKTASGSENTVTPNHPLYAIRDGEVTGVRADQVEEGDFVLAPRKIFRDETPTDREKEYWSGLLHGDGHVRIDEGVKVKKSSGKAYPTTRGQLALYIEEQSAATKFKDFISNTIEHGYVGVREPTPKRNVYVASVSRTDAVTELSEQLRIPLGNRRDTRIDNSHFTGDVKAFVTGLFDAEGHVDLNNNAIVFTSATKDYIDFVRYALLSEGILSRVYDGYDGKKKNHYYRLYIYGLEECRKFAERFGFRYPAKSRKLDEMMSKPLRSNPNVDVIPCNSIVRELLEAAKTRGASHSEVARRAGISQGLIQFIKHGERMPSRETTAKLAAAFESLGIECFGLRQLAEADVFWDRITAIEVEDYDGHVYDLTVSETEQSGTKPHNFVCEGLFVGNSMGTVHANTAQETIVRLTSPPMNVPDLMLAALDFIIVQKKIHDRRFGTIRRITEVAELYGVLEGKPSFNYIFTWDGATDAIKPTGVPSRFLQEVSKFTGASQTQINQEIERRKKLLEDLVAKNTRSIEEVSKTVHEQVG